MASREWVRFNDDARQVSNRAKKIAADGGEFIRCTRGWKWIAPVVAEKKVVKTKTKPVLKKVLED